jgi:hypothetical protein
MFNAPGENSKDTFTLDNNLLHSKTGTCRPRTWLP